MTERLHFHFSLSCIGEGNGNPLQCSCLENPGGGGAWWVSSCSGGLRPLVELCVEPAGLCVPRPWDSPGKNTGVGCQFLLQCRKVKRESEVPQSCPTLSNPMDRSPPGSSVHGIFSQSQNFSPQPSPEVPQGMLMPGSCCRAQCFWSLWLL